MTITVNYVSEKEDYFKKFILNKIIKNKGKICYITYNKSCDSLKEELAKKKININNIYFIDCVTKLLKEPQDNEQCKFIQPYEIKILEKHAENFIKKGANLILFDSISNLLIHGQSVPAGTGAIVRFIKFLNHTLMKTGGDAIFICKCKDKNNFLVEETSKYLKSIKNAKENSYC